MNTCCGSGGVQQDATPLRCQTVLQPHRQALVPKEDLHSHLQEVSLVLEASHGQEGRGGKAKGKSFISNHTYLCQESYSSSWPNYLFQWHLRSYQAFLRGDREVMLQNHSYNTTGEVNTMREFYCCNHYYLLPD